MPKVSVNQEAVQRRVVDRDEEHGQHEHCEREPLSRRYRLDS